MVQFGKLMFIYFRFFLSQPFICLAPWLTTDALLPNRRESINQHNQRSLCVNWKVIKNNLNQIGLQLIVETLFAVQKLFFLPICNVSVNARDRLCEQSLDQLVSGVGWIPRVWEYSSATGACPWVLASMLVTGPTAQWLLGPESLWDLFVLPREPKRHNSNNCRLTGSHVQACFNSWR